MLIKEIKQIIPANDVFATFTGDDGQIDKSSTDPVVLWAICVCQDKGETLDAVLGFVSMAEEGLQPAEDVANFAEYVPLVKLDS